MAESKSVFKRVVAALLLLLSVSWVAGCAPATVEPPEITVDHSPCAHCGMLISEPRYAAAYRIDDRDMVFDDIGCMLQALADEPAAGSAGIWFGDADDGEWITPEQAVFVYAAGLPTPMAGGMVAFRSREAADALAARQGGEVLRSFDDLKSDFAKRAASSGRETGVDR